MAKKSFYGLIAEFDQAEDVIKAAHAVHSQGYKKVDAYSPFPIEELSEAVGAHGNILPRLVLCGGITGLIGGFFMQWYANVISYPLVIGGKPMFSWPSFIPIAYELTILCSALTTVVGMLWLNGLPLPYHPVFNEPAFENASRDKFYLCIEAEDPKFDADKTKQFLHTFNPRNITEVAH
jgi:hypothetical protein